jgi:hypothetical protein
MSLDVKFSATDAGFTSTVSKVKESVKSMDESVEKTSKSVNSSFGDMVKAGAALAVGFGAIKAVGNAIVGTLGTFKDALDLGGTMADLADQTGETAGNLLILQRAFQNSGLSADQVGTSINKIQKTLVAAAEGSDEAEKKFNKLGLKFSDLQGKSPTQQFQILAEAISKLPTPAEKSAAAIEWFGKSGGKSLAFMQNFSGAVEEAKGQLGSMPGIMDQNSVRFDDISDKINVIKGKFLEFASGLLTSIAPALELATDLMSKFDAAGAGMKLGKILTGASQAMGGFTDALSAIKLGEFGLAFDIAFSSIKLQAADSINSIFANFKGFFAALGELINRSGIVIAIDAMVMGITNKISSGLRSAIADFLSSIGKFEAAKEMLLLSKADEDRAENYFTTAKAGFASLGSNIVNAMGPMQKAYDDAVASSEDLIGTSMMALELKKHQSELDKLEAEARSKSAKSAAAKLTIEEQGIKIAKDRLTHEERIKELDADIASAKRKGNAEEVLALQAMKAYHLELQASKEKGLSLEESIKNATQARQNIIDGVIQKDKEELAGKKEITKELEKQLGLGQKIIADANEAERKDRLDPGGKMEKAAAEAQSKGNFAAAKRIGREIETRERDRAFQEAFGKEEGGIGKSVQDIARELGVSTTGKSRKEIQDELMKKRQGEIDKRQKEMKPGEEGKKGAKPGEPAKPPTPPGANPENILQKSVDAIKQAVQNLEKKLPSPALGV